MKEILSGGIWGHMGRSHLLSCTKGGARNSLVAGLLRATLRNHVVPALRPVSFGSGFVVIDFKNNT